MSVDAYYTFFSKKEAVYGTDIVPTGAANTILTRNFKPQPVQVDQLDRKLDKPVRGASASLPANKRRQIGFEIELAGSGAAGTAPAWMEMIEGCGGAAPVLTALTDAKQKFAAIGTALSSLSNYHFVGNEKRIGVGARGDISAISFVAGEYPFLGFDFTELLPAAPFSTTAPAGVDYTRWKAPLEVNTVNTSFALDGYAAILRSMVLQANAEVKVRNLVGANYVQRGNHALKGKIIIELPTFAAKNYYPTLLAGTQVVMQIIHGTVAGNIVQLDASYLQILGAEDVSEDDIAMLSLDVQLNVNTGQDDILFTAK